MNRVASIPFALVAALLAAVLAAPACVGRDPAISEQNDDAIIEPPPPPDVRGLTTRRLFGTMPVNNRFQDPLLTFSGTGWFAFTGTFGEPVVARIVAPSATQTPFVALDPRENTSGVTLLGQLKTAAVPLHVELWAGRDENNNVGFGTVDASLAGLFLGQGGVGHGEQAVPLAAVGDEVVVDGRVWQRFAADMDVGPVGWSFILVADTARDGTLYVGGPVGVDVDPTSGAGLVPSAKRALRAHEAALVNAAREKTRQLALPSLPSPPLAGVPPVRPAR